MDPVAKQNQNQAECHENKIQKRHFFFIGNRDFWTAVNTINSQRHVHVSTKSKLSKVLCVSLYISLPEESNSSSHSFKTGLRIKRADNIPFSVSSGVQSADDLEYRA